jgi:hypothetical protein
MVSLVVGGILVGSVFNFVNGQARMASVQSAREEVQQNARGALEIVGTDLRGALRAGLVTAERQLVELYLPARWGVVCQSSATATVVMFPTDGSAAPGTGDTWGLMVNTSAAGWAPTAASARATITGVAVVSATDPAYGCTTLSPGGPVTAYRLTGANHPTNTTAGNVAMVYQRVRYDVAAGPGGDWIRRSNGVESSGFSMQPLAGPVVTDSVRLRYFAGTTELTPPVASPSTAGITSIRFHVRMASKQQARSTTGRNYRQDSVTVQIRNTF